jgi:NADH-quinone oxidoreductase subunit C
MTISVFLDEVARRLEDRFNEPVSVEGDSLVVKAEALTRTAAYLTSELGLEFDCLDMLTAVDYPEHFELVYRLLSLRHNHSLVLRVRCGKDSPCIPSLTSLWRGADFQEREVYDLFGIRFEGHPKLRRIALWEGFEGHPLRKDYRHGA